MASNGGVRIGGLIGGGVAALAVAGLAVIFGTGAGAGSAPLAASDPAPQNTQNTQLVAPAAISADVAPVDSSQLSQPAVQAQPTASADPGVIYVFGPPPGGEHEGGRDSNKNGDD